MLLLIPFVVYHSLPLMRPPGWAVLEAPTRHVRAENASALDALSQGYRRSSTFASIVDRLETTDVVAYVTIVPQLPAPLRARSEMVTAAASRRYVRIEVAAATRPDETVALVAHELRHALEIADAADVIDETTMERLYRRIGTQSGPRMFETEGAVDTEYQVRKELRARG